jgi:hypothetical protein
MNEKNLSFTPGARLQDRLVFLNGLRINYGPQGRKLYIFNN